MPNGHKICFFIGHRDASDSLLPALIAEVECHVAEYGVDEFVVGRYGNFDAMAGKAVKAVKERHPTEKGGMEPMKEYHGVKIIGIDNGYGNIKTANCCFPAGLTAYDTEPVFKDDLLVYGGRYYLIGAGHKEFAADKTGDDDYYILTLAAVARELNVHGLTTATVRLAVGLPLTWVSQQREDFKVYLMRSREVSFTFRGKVFRVEIVGVDVFPQGFAGIASQIKDFSGVNMLCDIGNGTMNIMFINDRKPAADRMFTEKYGTHQCMLAVRENVMRTHHATVDDSIINRVLRFGAADIQADYLDTIRETAAGYVREIFRILREHEYNPALMRLYVLGGGGCLIRNFGEYDADRVTINEDICATAKGYEYLCDQSLHRSVKG